VLYETHNAPGSATHTYANTNTRPVAPGEHGAFVHIINAGHDYATPSTPPATMGSPHYAHENMQVDPHAGRHPQHAAHPNVLTRGHDPTSALPPLPVAGRGGGAMEGAPFRL